MFERYRAYRTTEHWIEERIRALTDTLSDGIEVFRAGRDAESGTMREYDRDSNIEHIIGLTEIRLPIMRGEIRPRQVRRYTEKLRQMECLYADLRELYGMEVLKRLSASPKRMESAESAPVD